MTEYIRVTLDLTGILQGVGFRPTLARLVATARLSGWTRNQSGCVRLVLAGEKTAVEMFIADLPANLPSQARLETMRVVSREPLPPDSTGEAFLILDSVSADKIRISIPADLAMCNACMREVLDRESRFYGYPFTTCTHCGPRYTVVETMPYDRERTSLKAFPLCHDCSLEYTDSFNRRFHAESIACPKCGPSLSFHDGEGRQVQGDPLRLARRALHDGKIVAVRGIGGFLLAADAFETEGLRTLREKKQRPAKPFAVMARNLDVVSQYCHLNDAQEEILRSSKAPIAILDLKEEFIHHEAFSMLAPHTGTLGVMLPTTPLHLLLAQALEGDDTPNLDLLMMTSGNRGGEPICISNEDAFERLRGIADYFLCHNREIRFRCDDSLVRYTAGKMRVLRRARGFAPTALRLHRPLRGKYLAFGADLKNTVALGFNGEIVMSPHIGDLETVPAIDGLERVIGKFPDYFHQQPNEIIVDMHPDMQSVRLGRQYAKRYGLPVREVQHHHAHAAGCMAEHGLETALGLVFDGTGYGTDGRIWGAELLHVFPGGFERMGTFKSASLPGGDAAVVHPVRQLIARWVDAGATVNEQWLKRLDITDEQFNLWRLQCEKRINTVQTHAAGRVFDAVSVLLGVSPNRISYEGQGAIWLEAVAKRCRERAVRLPYRAEIVKNRFEVDFSALFSNYASKAPDAEKVGALALGFHQAVIAAGTEMALFGRDMTGENRVVLSGGVMMNQIVAEGMNESLKSRGFEVFLPSLVPVNDGGISLGQIFAIGGKK
ncbi:MAG: carbamoyltransferase HypF [Deltaproteobacteria bacterium]|nr:carbamoyltransferase HypF [Deltaproteobacteria bacterium]MBN2670489.1 carbamoyltransferase HypF [Deltaproteobacteria bacterium]